MILLCVLLFQQPETIPIGYFPEAPRPFGTMNIYMTLAAHMEQGENGEYRVVKAPFTRFGGVGSDMAKINDWAPLSSLVGDATAFEMQFTWRFGWQKMTIIVGQHKYLLMPEGSATNVDQFFDLTRYGSAAQIKAALDPNYLKETDVFGWSPLMYAAERGEHSIFDLLAPLTTDLHYVNAHGLGVIDAAALSSDLDFFRYCLTAIGLKDDPLIVATKIGSYNMVSEILFDKRPPDVRDASGQTPLMLAASAGYQEICQLLLGFSADTELVDATGKNALARALEGGHTQIAKMIKEASAD